MLGEVNVLKRVFGLESELELIKRTYPEALLYEEYKSKYSDKVKLMKEDDTYYIKQIHKNPQESRPTGSHVLWVTGDTISKENFAKYKYVMYCIGRYETIKPEPKEV